MALSSSQRDREYFNFKDNGDGTTSRFVHITGGGTGGGSSGGSILDGVEFDEIQASYPSSTVEVYVYKLLTVTQATITVTYTSSTKDLVQSVVKS